MSEKISVALADAWKGKKQRKLMWSIDCDIHAPIIVIPQNCSHPEATVLVFDMGRLRFVYGNEVTPRIAEWFQEKNNNNNKLSSTDVDHALLEMKNLTFYVSKASRGDWRLAPANKSDGDDCHSNQTTTSQAIIEPLSIILNIGMDNNRTCVFGVLPSISVQISPQNVTNIFAVLNTWMAFLNTIMNKNNNEDDLAASNDDEILICDGVENGGNLDDIDEDTDVDAIQLGNTDNRRPPILQDNVTAQKPNISAILPNNHHPNSPGETTSVKAFDCIHISIALRRLSATFIDETGESLEAHLVSVVASTTKSSDGSSSNRLCMGWFWILDRLFSKLPRRQRLVVHSTLPQPAAFYLQNGEYNIMSELRQMGVFEQDYNGSSELADITLTTSPQHDSSNTDVVSTDENDLISSIVIDASFSSLFINWNPEAVKNLIVAWSKITNLIETSKSSFQTSLSTRATMTQNQVMMGLRNTVVQSAKNRNFDTAVGTSLTSIRAEMKKLEIGLHSAKDDLPIFVLTMSDSKVDLISSEHGGGNLYASITVGDLRMETPPGRIYSDYQLVLGLAPKQSTSLLTVTYTKGVEAVASNTLVGVDKANCEACADVELSPMKFVFIQAQILTLLEYITEGVLGAMTAQVASSAAAAAIEATRPDAGEKLFQITASGFDIVIPQAANVSEHLNLNAGNFVVRFRSLADFAGSKAQISLRDVSMKCHKNIPLVDIPIRMTIGVFIPPIDAPTPEDLAIRADLKFSEASFLLSREHYAQIMLTLDQNIGENDPFLRELAVADTRMMSRESHQMSRLDSEMADVPPKTAAVASNTLNTLTHAGVTAVKIKRRIYMKFKFEVVGINIIGGDEFEPIVSLAAVKTNIALQLLPDEDKICAEVNLHNLCVEDKRISSSTRHFRNLVSRLHHQSSDNSHTDDDLQDVFHLNYVKYANDSKEVDLTVGSHQVIILPDVISEVLKFSNINDLTKRRKVKTHGSDVSQSSDDKKIVKIRSDNVIDEIETTLEDDQEVKTINVSLKLSDSRIILVDMGSIMMDDTSKTMSLKSAKQLTETIVFQGKMDIKMDLELEAFTNSMVSSDIHLLGEQFQAYVAQGNELNFPVQIMEPAMFTAVLRTNKRDDDTEDVEFKTACLSPIDITISMQNVALLNAISSSIIDMLQQKEDDHERDEEMVGQLSKKELSHIQNLSSALKKQDDWDGDVSLTREESLKLDLSHHSSRSSVVSSVKKIVLRTIRLNATIPDVSLTLINDLQGLDIALFKIMARTLVGGGSIKLPVNDGSAHADRDQRKKMTKFDVHLASTFLADYFDTSTNLWHRFLVKPWEMTSNAKRNQETRLGSERMLSNLDIESYPCHISFSEQFLVSIGAAKNMWSLYSGAMNSAISRSMNNPNAQSMSLTSLNLSSPDNERRQKSLKKSMAANAARALVTTLPYGIDNHTGTTVYFSLRSIDGTIENERHSCDTGNIQYFRFEFPRGEGVGGKRVYGQDVKRNKMLEMYVENKIITIDHIDGEVTKPRKAHDLGNGCIVFIDVVKTAKATLICLSSHVRIHNSTNLPFSIAVLNSQGIHRIGVCHGRTRNSPEWRQRHKFKHGSRKDRKSSIGIGSMSSKQSSSLGVPMHLLQEFEFDRDSTNLYFLICPHTSCEADVNNLDGKWGLFPIPPLPVLFQMVSRKRPMRTSELNCNMTMNEIEKQMRGFASPKKVDPNGAVCAQICVKAAIVDLTHPSLEVFLQPRSVLHNKLPVSLMVRTPMSYTFAYDYENDAVNGGNFNEKAGGVVSHLIEPEQSIEIFTSGATIAVSAKCADCPVAGHRTEWLEGGWVDLPLGKNRRLTEPMRCIFPFAQNRRNSCVGEGIEFFISEALDVNSDSSSFQEADQTQSGATISPEPVQTPEGLIRSIFFTIQNFAVDFTGQLMFEPGATDFPARSLSRTQSGLGQSSGRFNTSTKTINGNVPVKQWSAFSCPYRGRRVTLLPGATVPIRLVQLTIEGDEGMRRSLPFLIDDISICQGGLESSPILWDDSSETGYYAYRQFRSFNQSEIRIVPEFIVFNGSNDNTMVVKQPHDLFISLRPGKIAPVQRDSQHGLVIMVEIPELGGSTSPLRVDTLGMKICVVTSSKDGAPLGSLAIQTVAGNKDSRFVIKIGSVKFGGRERNDDQNKRSTTVSLFYNDFLRLRFKWSEMEVTLNDTQGRRSLESKVPNQRDGYSQVAQITLQGFVVDYQRIFKDKKSLKTTLQSPERSQISVIIQSMTILDLTPNSRDPIVFSSSSARDLFDMCIRINGPLDAELVKVELIDINCAYSVKTKTPNTIVVSTGEDFVWSLIDIIDRILVAISDVSGFQLELNWDSDTEEYVMSIIEIPQNKNLDVDESLGIYRPPKSDKLFDIKTARVSPIKLLLSFRRQPQTARYQKLEGVQGARLMNYFTRRLKFTVDKADLYFVGYIAKSVKGPPDRIIELIKAVYISRMKKQAVNLMTAVSIQDWKYLTARGDGSDEYVEGDELRLTGNMVGRASGYVLKKVSQGLGDGVIAVTSTFGNEFQNATEMIGAGVVGAGVNSVVTGLGTGVGSSVKGVGKGAGNIVRGAGRGVGHVIGGVGGGVQLVAKGVGRGIMTGDGQMVLRGFSDGASSVGMGLGQGVETVAMGARDGVVNVGQGLFSGIMSIGEGIGGAFTGGKVKKPNQDRDRRR